MRASRLLSMLLLLQTRGRLTAPQLAAELEVSVRTVYRDAESLAAAGIPIYADRGPAGGFQLLDGFRTRLTGLTGEEAASVFLAGMPDAAAELGLGAVLAATELKLLAALPPELRTQASRVRERFHLDAPSWFREADQVPALGVIADAVWQQRRLHIDYQRAWRPAAVQRTVDPLGLVLKAGVWYLVARDSTAAEPTTTPRAYRIARIQQADRVDESFDRPADFDLAAFWADRSRELHEQLYRGEAEIRLSPRGRQLLFLLGRDVVRAADETAGPPDAAGWVRVRIPIETEQHALHELLRLGAEVEVLGPPGVLAEVAATAAAVSAIYAK